MGDIKSKKCDLRIRKEGITLRSVVRQSSEAVDFANSRLGHENATVPAHRRLVLSPAFHTAGYMRLTTIPPPSDPFSADRIMVPSALPLSELLSDQLADALYHLDNALDLLRRETSNRRLHQLRSRLQGTYDELNAVMRDFAD